MSDFKPTNRERFFLEDVKTLYERYGEIRRKEKEGIWYWPPELIEYAKQYLNFRFFLWRDNPYDTVYLVAPSEGKTAYKQVVKRHEGFTSYEFKPIEKGENVHQSYIVADGTLEGFMETAFLSYYREAHAINIRVTDVGFYYEVPDELGEPEMPNIKENEKTSFIDRIKSFFN